MRDLSHFSGVSRSTLFRTVKSLRDAGLMAQEGRGFGQPARIVMTLDGDRAALHAIALKLLLSGSGGIERAALGGAQTAIVSDMGRKNGHWPSVVGTSAHRGY